MAETAKIRLKRGSTATWTAEDNNKTDGSLRGKAWLEEGQPGVEYTESNDVRLKVGPKGGGYWKNTPYIEEAGLKAIIDGPIATLGNEIARVRDKHSPSILWSDGSEADILVGMGFDDSIYSKDIFEFDSLRATLDLDYRNEDVSLPIILYKVKALPCFYSAIYNNIESMDYCFYGVAYNGMCGSADWSEKWFEVALFIDKNTILEGQSDDYYRVEMYSPLLNNHELNRIQLSDIEGKY